MSFVKNILATIGLVSLLLMTYLAVQMHTVFNRIDTFDEKAIDIYSDFFQSIYEKGSTVDAMVLKVKVQPGIPAQEVAASIRTIANELNIKNVGEMALSDQVQAMSGKPYRYARIFLLCNAMTAASMLNYNNAFSSFLPCRVSLIEDQQGQLWMYTFDLNLMIHGGKPIPQALKEDTIKVRDILAEIMRRAATGDF